jgi:hypothetical protein
MAVLHLQLGGDAGGTMDTNRELLLQLLDDTAMLTEVLAVGSRPTPAACRALLVPMLRRWVADGQFYQVQKVLRPHAVKFPLHLMRKTVERCEAGAISHWMGVIEVDQIGMGMLLPAPEFINADGSNRLAVEDDAKGQPSLMPASAFFNQRLFYWKKQFYTRSQVLQFHANKLGGVHFDPRRSKDEEHVDELVQFFGLEIVGGNQQMLVGADIAVAKADPQRRGQTYDAMDIVALDTARIFAEGVSASRSQIASLLAD